MKFNEPKAFIAFLLLMALTITLGGPLGLFINIPSALVCILFPICFAILSLGAPTTYRSIRTLRCIVSPKLLAQTTPDDSIHIHQLIIPTYAAGIIGTLVGWIQIGTNLNDPAQLGPAFAVSLLTLLYAICIAEAILRPVSRRITHYHEQEAP